MCIAIHKPKGIKIPEHVYRECFSRQPHGGGFCYVGMNKKQQRHLIMKKGFMEFAPMLKAIQEVEEAEMVIHFRRASCGGVGPKMTHPFTFDSGNFPQYEFAMVHNGTLRYHNETDKSDTACFVDEVLAPIADRDPYFFENDSTMFLLRCFLEKNKFIIMRYDNEKDETTTYIINEKEGEKAYGCWFSNTSYIPIVPAYDRYEEYRQGRFGHGAWAGSNTGGLPFAQTWFAGAKEGAYKLNEYGYWVLSINTPTVLGADGKPMAETKAQEAKKAPPKPIKPITLAKLTLIMRFNVDMMPSARPHDIEISKMPDCITKGKGTNYEFQGKIEKVYSESEIAEMRLAYADYIAKKDQEDSPQDDDGKPDQTSLRHLTKSEKRELKRLIADYLLQEGVDIKTMQLPEMVKWMRDDIRTNVPALELVEDEDIDRWVLVEAEDIEVRYLDMEEKLEKQAEFDAESEKAAALADAKLDTMAHHEGWGV